MEGTLDMEGMAEALAADVKARTKRAMVRMMRDNAVPRVIWRREGVIFRDVSNNARSCRSRR